jgi:DivIVA domain-containing protein
LSEQRRVPAAIRNVAFPVARRGYDRRAVDAYVTRINRLIAELEATRSPRDAVQHALERSEEDRSAMLAHARATAAQIIESAQQEAEEITAAARADAASIVVDASTRADGSKLEADAYVAKAHSEAEQIVSDSRAEAADQLQRASEEIAGLRNEAQEWFHDLRSDTERVWNERRELIDDLRLLASRLQEAVDDIQKRSRDASPTPDSRHTQG